VTVKLAQITYAVRYDAEADVAYLRALDHPGPVARTSATTDGHAVSFNEAGEIVGLTIMDAKRLVEEHRAIDAAEPIDADELAPAVGAVFA